MKPLLAILQRDGAFEQICSTDISIHPAKTFAYRQRHHPQRSPPTAYSLPSKHTQGGSEYLASAGFLFGTLTLAASHHFGA